MKKEFVTYEQAVALKELGFNEKCMGYFDVRLEHQIGNFDFTEIKGYDKSIAALSPLKQQAFRWFREKYELIGLIEIGTQEFNYDIYDNIKDRSILGTARLSYNDIYEEAENACIDKLIQIAKK
jgi:predicted GNAT superfamily acetyltransferase